MSLFVACWFAAIGAFRSSLLFRLLDVVPSQVRFVVDWLLCFLIIGTGIQASGISIPLSLLMLLA